MLVSIQIGPHDKDEINEPRPQQTDRPYYPHTDRPYNPHKDRPYTPRPRPTYRPDHSENPPQQYRVAIGDGTKLSCEIENVNKRTSWRRQDGSPLPSSAYLSGSDLVRRN